jgi:hypothetical protein
MTCGVVASGCCARRGCGWRAVPARNDGSSHARRLQSRGTPARRCHLRLFRPPAASTCLTSWPRSRIRGRSAVAGTRWPGYRRLALDAGHPVRVRLVIAIYGKTVRGAKGKKGKAPHLVAALAHGIGAVLGQLAVDEKSLVTVRRSWATWAAPSNSIQDGASSLDRAAGMPAVVAAHGRDGGDGSPGQLLELPVQRGHVSPGEDGLRGVMLRVHRVDRDHRAQRQEDRRGRLPDHQ